MKKVICLLLMTAVLCGFAMGETALPELDLFAYEFGVSEETVIAGSGEPAGEDTRTNKMGITRHFLNYDVQSFSQKWNLSYLFVDGRLLEVDALLDLEQADAALDPTEMYNQVCGFMTEKMGDPTSVSGPEKIKDGPYAGGQEYVTQYSKDKVSGICFVVEKDSKILLLQFYTYLNE